MLYSMHSANVTRLFDASASATSYNNETGARRTVFQRYMDAGNEKMLEGKCSQVHMRESVSGSLVSKFNWMYSTRH